MTSVEGGQIVFYSNEVKNREEIKHVSTAIIDEFYKSDLFCEMSTSPTYTIEKALLLMCELDLHGLKILWDVICEEQDRYSQAELIRLKKVYKYCVLTEKKYKRLL
jgi:hypothetical protein